MDEERLTIIEARWAPKYDGANQDANDVLDLVAEVERLRDGIAAHRDFYCQPEQRRLAPHPGDKALWALLDGAS